MGCTSDRRIVCSRAIRAIHRFTALWSGIDQTGVKRNIAVRNVVGTAITGTAVSVGGAWSKSGGYLAGTDNGPRDQVDLLDFSMDGFAIDGATLDGGYGIVSTAEKLDLRNGRITNFSRGIVATHECTRMTIESVDISGCKQCAMQIGQTPSIYNPPRQKMGIIRNCFIAGNSVGSPGASAAIELDLCATFIIEANRFGYESAHDGITEATQGAAVRIGPQAHNVILPMQSRRRRLWIGNRLRQYCGQTRQCHRARERQFDRVRRLGRFQELGDFQQFLEQAFVR